MNAEKKQRLKEMRDICIPENKRVGDLVVKKQYDKMGFLFTRLFVKTRITPNQITVAWGLMMVFFSLLFLFGDPLLNVVAAAGWLIALSMDFSDGQVARYKNMTSKRGQFLDTVNHCITWPLLFFCTGLGAYFTTGEILHVVFGFLIGTFLPFIMLTPVIYNSSGADVSLKRTDNGSVEGTLFKTKERYKRIRDINPLTILNMHVILLIATILDLIFSIEFLWMTSFLTLLLPFYGIGYPAGALARAVILCRRLKET